MKNILMINVPFAGHTNPTLPLAKALVERGHHVIYINAEEFRDKIEATGAKFIPYIHYPKHPTTQQRKRMCFRAAYDTALSLSQKFDLLIYEFLFYPGRKLAGILHIPCIRQFSQPAWNEATFSDAPRMFRLASVTVDRLVMPKKDKQYMKLSDTCLMKSVLYDKPDLNIVYVPSVLQNRREMFDESYVFAVPPVTMSTAECEIPFDKMEAPIIYISLGSIIKSRMFYRKCIKAFKNTEFSVILNTGSLNPKSLGPMPKNIFAYSFVPQIEVLKHVDVFLTHCGMNSVNEALYQGVPMITMPLINDQITNAKWLSKLGIGLKITPMITAKNMYSVAKTIISRPAIHNRARKIAKQLHKESFNTIVDQVEGIIKI